MTRNGQFCPIHNFSNLSPLKWLRMTWNGQFSPICSFSNLFPPKWLRMTWNGQFHLIHNFSNLFPPKWLRMTRNGQFCMAKIKYTLIQGNFYERLPFYMDSCALSPMASLLTKVCPPLNISAEYQQFCMRPTEQDLFFQAGQNESKEWYAMIKTYKNVIISVVGISTVDWDINGSTPNLQNRAHFSKPVEMSPRSSML